MAEGVGIEPTEDKIIAPHTALKTGTATRRHPLPKTIYDIIIQLQLKIKINLLHGLNVQ